MYTSYSIVRTTVLHQQQKVEDIKQSKCRKRREEEVIVAESKLLYFTTLSSLYRYSFVINSSAIPLVDAKKDMTDNGSIHGSIFNAKTTKGKEMTKSTAEGNITEENYMM